MSTRKKSQIYGEFLPALNDRRARLLDLPRLTGQLVALERPRHAVGGRDSIDHAPGSHDDVANAVCGVLVNIIADPRPALVERDDMLQGGLAPPLPKRCRHIVGVFQVGNDGTSACVYAAFSAPNMKPGMLLIDFDIGPMRGGEFAFVSAKIHALLEQCGASGASVFVPDALRLHALAAGLPTEPIPPEFLPEERLLSVAAHVAAGEVKICAPALDKARNSPFAGGLDLRAGENAEDPLCAPVILLIALGLERT